MNTMQYIRTAGMALLTLLFIGCSSEEDSASQTMTISAIYLEDASSSTTIHDRKVESVRLGQLIRVEGSGFEGLKKIYINGYETYFNTAMMTDNNVWLTVNKKTPVEKANPAVRNTLVFFKTDDNKVSYNLTIRAAAPFITHFNNSLPQPGETVIVYGENLQETTSVLLPSGKEIVAADITNDADGEWFSFVMPAGETLGGAISSTGANGKTVSPACFNNRNGMIIDFDGVGGQGFWGWKADGSMINADDLTTDPLGSGRGKVCQLIPQRLITAGGVGVGPRKTEVWTTDTEDFSKLCIDFNGTTPITDLAFQFDIYVPDEWDKTGQIQITMLNNVDFLGYGADENTKTTTICYTWVPWLNSDGSTKPFKTTGWQTVTIPLSEFSVFKTELLKLQTPLFQELLDMRDAAEYNNVGMAFVNSDIELSEDNVLEASKTSQLIYVDNFRIVLNTAETISDFDD